MLRARNGEDIEASWAFDAEGKPTTNADMALKGSMAPAGGYKGFGIGLVAELLASCLAGAVLSKDASPFAGPVGGPPSTGQCFIAFDVQSFSGDVFSERVGDLIEAISSQQGAHLPGDKAKRNRAKIMEQGVNVSEELLSKIKAYNAAET